MGRGDVGRRRGEEERPAVAAGPKCGIRPDHLSIARLLPASGRCLATAPTVVD